MTTDQPQPSSEQPVDNQFQPDRSEADQPEAERLQPDGGEDGFEAGLEGVRNEQADLNTRYDALKQEPGADNRE